MSKKDISDLTRLTEDMGGYDKEFAANPTSGEPLVYEVDPTHTWYIITRGKGGVEVGRVQMKEFANLFTAAEDMREALEKLEHEATYGAEVVPAGCVATSLLMARSALAKARGERPEET